MGINPPERVGTTFKASVEIEPETERNLRAGPTPQLVAAAYFYFLLIIFQTTTLVTIFLAARSESPFTSFSLHSAANGHYSSLSRAITAVVARKWLQWVRMGRAHCG